MARTRPHLPRSTARLSFLQRFSRFLLLPRLHYFLWICIVVLFFVFMLLSHMLLPEFVINKSGLGSSPVDEFEPPLPNCDVSSDFAGMQRSFGYRKPQIAVVFADLLVDPQQLLMVTVATALLGIGYEIQVFSLEDGPVYDVWTNIGVSVIIMQTSKQMEVHIDWLNYDGILVNSLEAKDVVSSLMQDPFKSVPLIWTIHERTLAIRSRQYASNGQVELLNDWKEVFNRATVVVFPNYVLQMMYATFAAGNYLVIPGTPAKAWEADTTKSTYEHQLRVKMGCRPEDAVIAIVGSQYLYRDLWMDHVLILNALSPILAEIKKHSFGSHLKIIVLSGDSSGNYSSVVEAMALSLRYPRDVVKHLVVDENVDVILHMSDLVIYGSILEEKSFPDILMTAMSFGKPIIAPDLSMIRKYVKHKVNGYLFPEENMKILTRIVSEIFPGGKLSPLARSVASTARLHAKNLMVSETVEGYASLLEHVVKLPSDVAYPKSVTEIPPNLKGEWQWHVFEKFSNLEHPDKTMKSFSFLTEVEKQWNYTHMESSGYESSIDDSFSYSLWEEHNNIDRERLEEEEAFQLIDRNPKPLSTWEELHRNTKKADRSKNDLHERFVGELERTGQPLCIYEPFFGEGTWPFLHLSSLYRGIGLSTKGLRPGTDDIDAPSRLPLLNISYYRDTLGEFGAFFSIANQTDRVHKNSWIGFQSWRATARKASLSRIAENALLGAIKRGIHGDTLYFWVRQDMDPRNPSQLDFWSFCDAINAGNCRSAFSNALKRMYGIKHDFDALPPMPVDGHTWSVMHSWALPTRSFLEFVMFLRMFVDALDAEMYEEHHRSGNCPLSLYKDKHCYSRMLELLINVWAFHSARRMVYVNPETGTMLEQHKLEHRRGRMWIKWFTYDTLKSMGEDLAEEADTEPFQKRWLWPLTGEVVWQGALERQWREKKIQKEIKRQRTKARIERMKKRRRYEVIGKYMKPPPEATENSDSANQEDSAGTGNSNSTASARDAKICISAQFSC